MSGAKRFGKIAVAVTCSSVLAWSSSARAQDDAPQAQSDEVGSGDIVVTARRRAENLQEVPVAVSVLQSQDLEQQAILTQQDLQRSVPGLTVRPSFSRLGANFVIRGQSIDSASSSPPGVLPYVNEFQSLAFGSGSFYDLDSIQVLKGPQGTLFGRNTTGGAVLITTKRPDFDSINGFATVNFGSFGRNNAQAALNIPLGDTLAIRLAGDRTRENGYIRNLIGPDFNNTRRYSLRGSLRWKPSSQFETVLVGEYTKMRGRGDSSVMRNLNLPGETGPAPYNVPLTATAAQFYSPSLDTLAGPGAYASLLAVSPGAPACGITCYIGQQQARGPYVVASQGSSPLVGPMGTYGRNLFITDTSTLTVSDAFTLKAVAGYGETIGADNYDLDASPFPIAFSYFAPSVKQWSAELQASGDLGKGLSYVTGIYYSSEKQNNFQRYQVFDAGPVANAVFGFPARVTNTAVQKISGTSVYANLDYDFGGAIPGLSMSAGGRYTWQKISARTVDGVDAAFPGFVNAYTSNVRESTKEDNPSWLVNLQYKFSRDLMVYVAHRGSWRGGGYNFISPPVDKIGSDGGNKFLPEKVKDVELGLKYSGDSLGVPMELNIAAYKLWASDIQRAANVALPTGFGTITYNVPGGATYKGIELQGSITPFEGMEFGGSFTHQTARYGTFNTATLFGTFLVFDTFTDLPKNVGSAYAQFTIPSQLGGNLILRGDYYAQSKQYVSNFGIAIPDPAIPSYELVTVRATWEDIANSSLSLSVYATNLLNKEYFIGGNSQGQQLGFNMHVPGQPRFFGVEAKYTF